MKALSFFLKRKDTKHQKSKTGELTLNFYSLEYLNHSSVTFGMLHLQGQYIKARRNVKESWLQKETRNPKNNVSMRWNKKVKKMNT